MARVPRIDLPGIAQHIGRRYISCFNARYRRMGTLWEVRFKSALEDSERYALACYRYIGLNPVRAGMSTTAIDYRWSSHGHNACGVHDPRIRMDQHATRTEPFKTRGRRESSALDSL